MKLPTYNECLNIVKYNEAFFMKEEIVDNVKVHIFSYRLADYKDFKKLKAFELRGLSFVYAEEKKEWKRFLALNKFFNINQNEDWMEEDVKNKEIIKIEEKVDGSLISFVLINDTVKAKTKMTFQSEQAIEAQKIINNNKNLYDFIYNCLIENKMPIFEYVSPFNQIVIEYKKTKLILLQIRDMNNGKYLNIENIKNIEKKKSFPLISLDKLLKLKATKKNIEGYVVFYKDKIVKIKTDWYFKIHRITSYDVMADNIIIKHILDETVDDILSQLSNTSEKRKYVEKKIKLVNHYFNKNIIFINKKVEEYYNKYNQNKKDFAIDNKKLELFPVIMTTLKNNNSEKNLKEYILRKTSTLNKAKEFFTLNNNNSEKIKRNILRKISTLNKAKENILNI